MLSHTDLVIQVSQNSVHISMGSDNLDFPLFYCETISHLQESFNCSTENCAELHKWISCLKPAQRWSYFHFLLLWLKQLKGDAVYLTCSSRILSITARKSRWQELEVASYFPYTVTSTVQWISACLLVLSSKPRLTDYRTQTQWVVLPTVGTSSHLSYYHQDGFPTGVLTGPLGLDNSLRTMTALVIPDCVTWVVRTTDQFCCWRLFCFCEKIPWPKATEERKDLFWFMVPEQESVMSGESWQQHDSRQTW